MKNKTILQWILVGFVILATAARESDLIVNDPWGKFVGLLIAGMYTWGILQRPAAAKVLLPVFLVVGLSSCGVAEAYLQADALTYQQVAPRQAIYLDQDSTLSNDEKARKKRTLEAWKLRILKNGGKIEDGK